VTGDFTETGALPEFQEALEFVRGFAGTPILGKERPNSSIFLVPGNHDVLYGERTPDLRLANFGWFLNAFYGPGSAPTDPNKWKLFYDDYDNSGVILLCLNSAMYVEKGKPDEDRPEDDLESVNPWEFRNQIQRRIEGSDRVIAVFLPTDPSVPVECAIASLMSRRILLIHDLSLVISPPSRLAERFRQIQPFGLPRILAGLDGLESTKWGPATVETILRFVSQTRETE
jgi:hypothetical protein